MSCEQNTILVENAFEAFICEYQDNSKFRAMIQSCYFSDSENYLVKHTGDDDLAVERVFQYLLQVDYGFACRDIIQHCYAFCKKVG